MPRGGLKRRRRTSLSPSWEPIPKRGPQRRIIWPVPQLDSHLTIYGHTLAPIDVRPEGQNTNTQDAKLLLESSLRLLSLVEERMNRCLKLDRQYVLSQFKTENTTWDFYALLAKLNHLIQYDAGLEALVLQPDASTQTDPPPCTRSTGTQIFAATTTTIGAQTDAVPITTTTTSTQTNASSRRSYADALIQTTTPMAPQRAAKVQHRADSTVPTREQRSTPSVRKSPSTHSRSRQPISNLQQTSADSDTNTGTSTSTNTEPNIYRTRAYVIHGVQLNKRLW